MTSVPNTSRRGASLALILLAAAHTGGYTSARAHAQEPSPASPALREFGNRTRSYIAWRTRLAGDVAPVSKTSTAQQIGDHQAQLARAIQARRRDARPGDVFTPPVVPQFRDIIRRDLAARDIRDALAAMQEVPLTLALHVNGRWPANAPRATVPARLLASLYPLPDGLEYRFLDRHLVLLDGEADLIVDYILDVVPSVVRRRH